MSRRPRRAFARARSLRQGVFPFISRSERLDRAFKLIILASTTMVALGMLGGTPAGRRAVRSVDQYARESARSIVGLPEDRAEVEARHLQDRLAGAGQARAFLEQVARNKGPTMREFLRVAGMDPESAVVRWGNFDWTLVLSSAVFEPDDSGRSYRLKPKTRSVWLIGLTIDKVQAMFEIPDTPEARRLGEAVGGRVVPQSVQTTNSWGCRGPEPDPDARVRGLVLGDSNMQGLLVGDHESPPARLEATLRRDLGVPVSILNTGHLGYSIEQYYYTLLAYHDRFRPQFVIVSICNNDFGDIRNPANLAESEYWLDELLQFCRTRAIEYLVVPVPAEDDMLGRRNESVFPGKLSAIYKRSGLNYVNPIEEFTDEHLRLRNEALREGRPFPHSPLFNRHHAGDNHLSPIGSALWARIVARRLERIWQGQPSRAVGTDRR
jgi:lysophospholipase L1-like esterase